LAAARPASQAAVACLTVTVITGCGGVRRQSDGYVAKGLAILKVVGDECKDFVVGDPLVFLANPLGLRRAPATIVADVVSIKPTKAIFRPAQLKRATKDVSLDLFQRKARRLS
jgi:hypothetical protein